MPTLSTSDAANFVGNVLVSRALTAALKAGVETVMVPTQIAISLGIAISSSAGTFLIMTAANLAITGAICAGSVLHNNITYYFYKPEPPTKPLSEEWDNCDYRNDISPLSPIEFSAK